MRTRALLLIAVLGIPAASRAETDWTYVPASRDSRAAGSVELPYAPSEGAIRLVGVRPADRAPSGEPRKVFTIEIPDTEPLRLEATPGKEQETEAIPEGAHWPDASGMIAAAPADAAGQQGDVRIRNPWEVRVRARSAGKDAVFLCGGIICGGEGGPVAFLNGRVVRKGDTLGKFGVARVLAAGVLLERDGSYYVLPRGRRTTITAGE